MTRNKGFSLIEMLVATAILSMVLLISNMGYSYFMERWGKANDKFSREVKFAKKLLMTKDAITAIFPFVVVNDENKPVIYFEGDKDGLVGVTGRSLFKSGVMAICRLNITQADDLTYSLHYEESPLDKGAFVSLEQSIDFSYQVTLISGMSDIELLFFGPQSLGSKDSRWWTTFNALSRRVMPESIRVTYVLDGIQQELDFPVNKLERSVLTYYEVSSF